MDALFEQLVQMSGDGSTMVSVFVFLSAAALAFGIMAIVQVRVAVKRRAAGIGTDAAVKAGDDSRSLRYASKIATQRLLDYTNKHYSGENAGEVKELRRRLLQAGYLDPRAPAFFFFARAVAAIAFAASGVFRRALSAARRQRHVLAADPVRRHPRLFRAEHLPQPRASRGGRSSIAPASRISWTCWWCAPTRG